MNMATLHSQVLCFQGKVVKMALTCALKEAKSLCSGLHSVLERRMAVCLPAISESCSNIILSSQDGELKHQACTILNTGLHRLPEVCSTMNSVGCHAQRGP